VRDLTYDAGDRITSYTHYTLAGVAQPALNQSFGYDELGRLTSITTAASSWTIGYDPSGNRTSVSLNGSASTYTTPATSNRLASLTNPARSLTYDASGNITADSAPTTGYTATVNLEGRVGTHRVGTVTNTYAYNGFGQRVRKFASTGATSTVIYVYDHQGKLIGEYSNTGAAIREYVWMQGEPLAVFTPNGTNPPNVFFLHNDHLGTPRVAMDGASNIRWRWLSEPFGTTAAENQPTAGQAALPIPLRMPGQMLDTETGLFYNWHRSYDSTTGRYTQSDPIGLDGGINTYAYVGGSPVDSVDPDGLRNLRPPYNPQLLLPYNPSMPTRTTQTVPSYTPSAGGYSSRTNEWLTYGDGAAAITGAGEAFRHPSVPNAVESLINPRRTEPFVRTMPIPGPNCRTIFVPDKPGQCSSNGGYSVVCGPVIGPSR
jgi:RHS repeat-associated protein